MGIEEELKQVWKNISDVRYFTRMLMRYRSYKHYQERYRASIVELNRSYQLFRAKLSNDISSLSLKEKLDKLDADISTVLSRETSDSVFGEKLKSIQELELFWPKLEVELAKLTTSSFEIPSQIPEGESRLDLQEAIKDYANGCYISALAMCRRAYEGALVAFYRSKTGSEPTEKVICPHCKVVLRKEGYMGIAKLHSWAIANGYVADKLKQVGFLLSDMGAGAAHPPLTEFPRDKEIAELGITATIALLKQIFRTE